MGLTLDDDVETALNRYMTMYDILSKAEKKTNKLSSNEKRVRKHNSRIKQNLSLLKKSIKHKKKSE